MRKSFVAVALLAGLPAAPAAARAQTFVTPFAGVTFGNDAPSEQPTFGASLLFMGNVAGFEIDFGYTPDFFGDTDPFDFASGSNVTSLSGNLVLGVGAGPVRPYVTGGVGLLRSRITSASDFFDEVSENDFGFNAGGGLIVMFSDHVGLRGDVRYFRSFEDIDLGDAQIDLADFSFWRAYGGVAFAF